jgi:hypothetical protein
MNALVDKLWMIFQNVNEWLKFAEAKNAILLAFSGTIVAANTTLLATIQSLPSSLRVGLLASVFLLCTCSFVCATSFLPKINLDKILWLKSRLYKPIRPQVSDNLYYFGHLKNYDSESLLNSINQDYLAGSIVLPYNKESKDLATQIIVNSDLAFRKYRLFSFSVYILLAAIGIVPIVILLSLIFGKGL